MVPKWILTKAVEDAIYRQTYLGAERYRFTNLMPRMRSATLRITEQAGVVGQRPVAAWAL